MKQVPLGARIRVTGICMVVQANTVNPSVQEVPFNILLRSFDDVALVAEPSWLSVRNLTLLVGLLLALVFAFMWAGNLFAWLSSATACCAAKVTESLD